ncbi:MAG: nucleoside-diphosphate sugar epimerase/dehydratase [Bacteroidales bacterium]|jgi:FlaA1/EpsC-like NDP-sugar epimerase|nr:nucleoside-diphosphate sugar epimerase/dehydratase [Bacteroidales bacterium]
MVIFERNTPRWLIFLMDTFFSLFSIIIAYFLSFNAHIPLHAESNIMYGTILVLIVRTVTFLVSKVYAGVIRHATMKDTQRIVFVVGLGSAILFILSLLFSFQEEKPFLPFATIMIDFILLSFSLIFSRVIVKGLYWKYLSSSETRQRVVIFGSFTSGIVIKQTIERDMNMSVDVVAFLVDNKKDVKKVIDGAPVFHYSAFSNIVEKEDINLFLFAEGEVNNDIKTELLNEAVHQNIKVLSIPKSADWINGELSYKQLKQVRVEDLLDRPPIRLDKKNIGAQVYNKTILVTGAAGSIGSEIVRQLTYFAPKLIILVDQAESPLYDIELELKEDMKFRDVKIIILSVTNKRRVKSVFQRFSPDIVYHAAAYKHVPMMENHPREAVYNNINGSKILADLSHEYGVDKFVMISTDKAVNPTNVMGASKRIAEIYIQSLNGTSKTKFITTRFGNVLGSNGSVIPRFKKQIENGGPVTVTHPDITRYFMTIPEACQLVLEAGAMGEGGEIFVFDMGQPVKIADFACKMIKLSGMTVGKDIKVEYTGLRPGEKLYEELLSSEEDTIPTYHKRILLAKVRSYNLDEVIEDLHKLDKFNRTTNHLAIVGQMKKIVPEFISQNSIFSQLDHQEENH